MVVLGERWRRRRTACRQLRRVPAPGARAPPLANRTPLRRRAAPRCAAQGATPLRARAGAPARGRRHAVSAAGLGARRRGRGRRLHDLFDRLSRAARRRSRRRSRRAVARRAAAGDAPLYADPKQRATRTPARIPTPLLDVRGRLRRARVVASERDLGTRARRGAHQTEGRTCASTRARVAGGARRCRARSAHRDALRRRARLRERRQPSRREQGPHAAAPPRRSAQARCPSGGRREPGCSGRCCGDWLRAGWVRLERDR